MKIIQKNAELTLFELRQVVANYNTNNILCFLFDGTKAKYQAPRFVYNTEDGLVESINEREGINQIKEVRLNGKVIAKRKKEEDKLLATKDIAYV